MKKLSGPLIALISLVVWTLLLEGAARAWTARYGDPLDQAMRVLRADAFLGWRQKSGLDLRFYGKPLHTDEAGFRKHPSDRWEDASLKVLTLGPSSAFGWGVGDEESYSAKLDVLLDAPGRAASVFNAGQIGFSTWQGLTLYEDELRGTTPDVVLIAYGVNDVDRHRFFFGSSEPDKIELAKPKSAAAIFVQNSIGRSAFVRGMGRLLRKTFGGQAAGPRPRRVEPEDMRENARRLIRLAKEDGAKVVMVGTPLRWEDYEKAGSTVPAERRSELEGLVADLRVINGVLREAAEREGVRFYDAGAELERLGSGAFVDPVHPSPQGHLKMAEDLDKIIRDMESEG